MPHANDAISNFFQLLASVVKDFYSGGRPCLGATLKPELFARANFSEQLVGFRRFGDFLRAAETAGYVQLRSSPGGDIQVWPVGVGIPEQWPRPTDTHRIHLQTGSDILGGNRPRTPMRVRQDLWLAFNSFSANWVYDPVSDIAQRESDTNASSRQLEPNTQKHLIQVPASRERVLAWMRSFANIQDFATRTQLLNALDGDSSAAPYEFNKQVRLNPTLRRSWWHFHVQQVLAAIEAWSVANQIKPKNITSQADWLTHPPVMQPIRGLPQTLSTSQNPSTKFPVASGPLADRLESLVDELIDDLIRLRGLLKVVVQRNPSE